MNILVKRSWLPWGEPKISVDYNVGDGMLFISGAIPVRVDFKKTDTDLEIKGKFFDLIIIDEK